MRPVTILRKIVRSCAMILNRYACFWLSDSTSSSSMNFFSFGIIVFSILFLSHSPDAILYEMIVVMVALFAPILASNFLTVRICAGVGFSDIIKNNIKKG